MKRLTILALLFTTFATSKIITILDKGVERKIYIPTHEGAKARMVNEKAQKGIVIAFKSDNIDITELEQEYSIKLTKTLTAGYKIFTNNSNLSDIELIAKLTKEKKDIIKTIRPNWGLGMMPN